MQNPFIWHDLMTSDVEAAKAFYGAVVGWTFEAQMPDYLVAQTNGGQWIVSAFDPQGGSFQLVSATK